MEVNLAILHTVATLTRDLIPRFGPLSYYVYHIYYCYKFTWPL